MRRLASRLVAKCLLPLCVVSAVRAAEANFTLNVAQSKVAFVLSDVLHTVRGTFRVKEGHLAFDPGKQAIRGQIVVDAASGASGNATRDRRMTHDILEAQRYPEIRFTAEKLTGSVAIPGSSDVSVTGAFQIHGQPHQITMPMHVQVSANDLTATGKFTVPYVEWGMKNPSTFILRVSQDVEIEITANAHISSQPLP